MDGKQALRRLQSADEQTVPIDHLKIDEALQPRAERLIPYRHKGRTSERSDDAIGGMRLTLEANKRTELEPLLVADIEGELTIVDGHHRAQAYRLAKRNTIPVRVYPLSRNEAVMASKVANCIVPRALEMHEEQRRECAWQTIADITLRGRRKLAEVGESVRSIAATFGIGHDTVHRMLKRMPELDLSEYSAEACDSGTGFPCWKYVRGGGAYWNDFRERMTMDQLTQHEAEKLAARIAGWLEGVRAEVRERAIEMINRERKEAAAVRGESVAMLAYDGADDSDF